MRLLLRLLLRLPLRLLLRLLLRLRLRLRLRLLLRLRLRLLLRLLLLTTTTVRCWLVTNAQGTARSSNRDSGCKPHHQQHQQQQQDGADAPDTAKSASWWSAGISGQVRTMLLLLLPLMLLLRLLLLPLLLLPLLLLLLLTPRRSARSTGAKPARRFQAVRHPERRPAARNQRRAAELGEKDAGGEGHDSQPGYCAEPPVVLDG